MLPHEEFLQKACEECMITQLVRDLGHLYFMLVNKHGTFEEVSVALRVDRILEEAADQIAALGPKPHIPHPMDKQ